MKHINRNFILKAWVPARWVDIRDGAEAKIKHVAYQIKAADAGNNMVAYNLPTGTPSTLKGGGGQKVKLYIFPKVGMFHM